jgi:Flp pilus assembly protein TadD
MRDQEKWEPVFRKITHSHIESIAFRDPGVERVQMGWRDGRWHGSVRTGAILLVAACALAACQNKTASLDADPLATASTSPSGGVSFKKTEAMAKQWNANPGDLKLGLAYAASLGQLGQRPGQVGVLSTLSERNPANSETQFIVGKELLKISEANAASTVLERAAQLNPADWQIFSAWGTALDQQARHVEAREKYQQALTLRPGELSVLNNMAMSYALQGKLPEAEKLLREALAAPDAKSLPRIRQNLALIIGLQGRFEESQKIASEDLPPNEVEANLAYLKQMLSRPNTWQELQADTQNQG